ncbi:MAG: VRR-NUC domain-containing protein [Chloroflexota bacterium]|nr:VRR-NUC domain-containing protein [Chloroflexota bacterium]
MSKKATVQQPAVAPPPPARRRAQTFLTPATPEAGRALLTASEPEGDFQARVVTLAETTGWRWWHDYDSRRNARGFPDLVLVRGEHLVFAELKTARGSLTREQRIWLVALTRVANASGGAVSVYHWRPGDWSQIERVLR